MVLHTLSAGPEHTAFKQCLEMLTAEDALLLMGDGVYAAIAGSRALDELLGSGASIHILHEDAAAAGVTPLPAGVSPCNMAGFVELSEHYARQMAWY